ncbi:MAG: HD domain-containing phosphohydrolase [Acidobacteriota bacterium]
MPATSSSFGTKLSYSEGAISFSEIISAMTFALDLTEGAVEGHALRSCLLGMRVADAMGLSPEERAHLYYALQLKDVGCSSNATRMTQIIGGDDRAMKASVKLEDWRKSAVSPRGLRVLWKNILPGKSFARRVVRFVDIALHASGNRKEMIQLRCDRGAQIVRKLEMDEVVAEAVRRLDEHWDGRGYPDGLKGEEIPLLSRICSVVQNLDVFAMEDSVDAALDVLRKRTGIWFDPVVVAVVEHLHAATDFWKDCRKGDSVESTRAAVLKLDPGTQTELTAETVDRICEAFASVVDAKSPFTFRHSIGVADVAAELAWELDLPAERIQLVRRAALLHDIGKLGVPNPILDKAGKLTPEEWDVVARHPRMTKSILERIPAFRELATFAAEHHEKLDGSGYPEGLRAEQMSIESRVLAIADMFAAMAENRPYRSGLEPARILEILAKDVPQKLDARCFAALGAVVERWNWLTPAEPTTEIGKFSRSHPKRFAIEDELAQLI